MISTFAAIGLAVSAVGAYNQYQAGKDAAAAQRRSLRLQQRQADLQAARERRGQYQQARIQRAAMLAGAAGSNQAQSSSAVTGAGSIGTQAGANVGFLNERQDLAGQQTIFDIKAATARGKAASWGAIGGLGTSLFSAGGGFTGGAASSSMASTPNVQFGTNNSMISNMATLGYNGFMK